MDFAFVLILGPMVAVVLNTLIPFLEPIIPDKGKWRTLVIRLIAGLIGGGIILLDGENGLVRDLTFLNELPFVWAVVLGGVGVAFWSGLANYTLRAVHAYSK